MSDQPGSSTETDSEKAAEDASNEAEAVDAATGEAIADVSDEVAKHGELADKSAAETVEVVDKAVEKAVKDTPGVTDEHVDEVYHKVFEKLVAEGHITQQRAEELAGPAADAEATAVEVTGDVPVEAAVMEGDPVTDSIAPKTEHWFFRKRTFLGREI